ncbi:MAG: HD domain-containing protein [Nitrospirae bacterium]|uniref:HD domain-containing protein n=1 Tax=Candidatus Magnetominusculus dajiuhuensis TaxID=3137712 RepID=UPI001A093833|nr:HD domain-containing protein [Nitrospirota bacterium]
MTKQDIINFKKWFSDFCLSYHVDNIEDQRNITLKEKHTKQVCANMVEIAQAHLGSDNEVLLAEAIALFHDTGRFPQYAKYKTFKDAVSINHGLLGAETLLSQQILTNLPAQEQHLILQCVKYHNAYKIPHSQTDETVIFLKMIRDADKLDIWEVFIELFSLPPQERASAATLGFLDTAGYSDRLIKCIYDNTMGNLKDVKSLNDYKILLLSWIFDINYEKSFSLIGGRDYIARFSEFLPQNDEIRQITAELATYVSKMAGA